jgi:hypothetical protein
MKKLILSTLLLCALNSQAQTVSDTTITQAKIEEQKKIDKKKRRHRTWDKISLGIFVVVTTYFFVRAKQ